MSPPRAAVARARFRRVTCRHARDDVCEQTQAKRKHDCVRSQSKERDATSRNQAVDAHQAQRQPSRSVRDDLA
jgi:hypothetical protein